MAGPSWILLSYRLPREPSRLRLAVWRRLRRLGATLLNDAIWVLPADARTGEAFEWLAEEVAEQGGSAFVWEVTSLDGPQDREIIRRFRVEADARYDGLARAVRDIERALGRTRRRASLPQLQTALRQLRGLERGLRLERRRDYFRAPGRVVAEMAVSAAVAMVESRLSLTHQKGGGHAVDHSPAAAH